MDIYECSLFANSSPVCQAVYVAVMQSVSKSNRSGYESLLKVYRETDLSQEKTRILGLTSLFGVHFITNNFCSSYKS